MARWRSGAVLVGSLWMTGGVLVGACGGSNGTVSAGGTDPETSPRVDAAAPAPVQSDTKASATVTQSGAVVATTTGVAVEIPTGALGNNVLVSIAASPTSTPPAQTTLAGTPQVFGPSGLQFARPVTVVLTIDPTKIPSGKTAADIVIYTAPEGTLDYTALPTKLRDITHVEASTTHFSVFVPVIPVAATASDAGVEDGGCAEPKTCGSFGPGACGDHDDGCGRTLSCGECAVDAGSDGGTCAPLTCANYEKSEGHALCATYPDGCGTNLSCTDGCAADAGPDADAGVDADAEPAPYCGDGALNGAEECDDGNTFSDDGCTSSCTVEQGYTCPTPGQQCVSADGG